MKTIVLFYFTIGISFVVGVDHINTCLNVTCVPDDEFENEETITVEWEELTNELWSITFGTDYTLPCRNNPGQSVIINYEDDFLWDLRFELYSEGEKTLNDCYCEFQGDECKTEAFRECMKSVRVAMENNLQKMRSRIGQKLIALSREC